MASVRGAQVGGQRLALALAHLDEMLAARVCSALRSSRHDGLDVDLHLLRFQHAGSAQHLLQRDVAAELERFAQRLELGAIGLRRGEVHAGVSARPAHAAPPRRSAGRAK